MSNIDQRLATLGITLPKPWAIAPGFTLASLVRVRGKRVLVSGHVPINPDGSAGAPAIAAGPDCAALAGADGLTVDSRGDLIVAVNRQNKVVRVAKTGDIDVVAVGGFMDFPASVAWSGTTMISTNFALANASSGKPARPGLLAISESP